MYPICIPTSSVGRVITSLVLEEEDFIYEGDSALGQR